MNPTLFEIAVVLSSAVFFIAPMFVAQAAGAGDDFVLGIYGNANEDDTIDMRDFTYTARIICWTQR